MRKLKLVVPAVLALSSVFTASVAFADTLVKIDGSSTVYPITEAVAEEFQIAKKNAIKVTVGILVQAGASRSFVVVKSILQTHHARFWPRKWKRVKLQELNISSCPLLTMR